MNRNRAVVGGLALAGGVALSSLVRSRLRRWAANADPTAGTPLDDLADLSPTVERLFTADDTALHLVTAGPAEGKLFIFAHCWTGDSRIWGPVARRLVQGGNRVVLYDHRGHGRSDPGAGPVDLHVLASDLADVLDHIDARDAVLVGHSLGGMTIQQLAADHAMAPGRVSAVALVATACQLEIDPLTARLGPMIIGNTRSNLPMTHPVTGALGVRSFFGAHPVLSHMRAAADTYLATHAPTRAQILEAMRDMRLAGSLADADVPVTVVVGDRDLHTPVRCAQAIVDSCPGARLVILPHAGHMLPFERPDALTELLTELVTEPALVSRTSERNAS